MDIAGAIFDCDGTLVDSMGMWTSAFGRLCARHGVSDVPQERVESISLLDGCALLHDEYGVEAGADELYEEICALVRDAYEHEVELMPGARRFLDELAAAGVPMIVASSTPVRELRCCLAAHDLSRYFVDVVSTEDVGGRDKEFPDVYLEAARRLGAPREATWVFEDAPFGVRTARRAGFAVVGLMNDHDGRREEDVRPHCDVFVHGFAELSVPLLRDYERPRPRPRRAARRARGGGLARAELARARGAPGRRGRTTSWWPTAARTSAARPAWRPTSSAATATRPRRRPPRGRAPRPARAWASRPRSTPRTSRSRSTARGTRRPGAQLRSPSRSPAPRAAGPTTRSP